MPPPAATPDAARRLASDTVHERLRADILGGRHAPGDALPSERSLSESFSVNRHAVREAVKRLQQAGLVDVTHGGATRVRDWRRTGGLELLADLRAFEDPTVLRSVAEMRVSIGADAARLCAERADALLRERLTAHAGRHGQGETFDARLIAYESLWADIVDGSGNLAYRLAYNALVAARRGDGHGPGTLDARIYAAEIDDRAAVADLAGAIARADAPGAQTRARALLGRTLEHASR